MGISLENCEMSRLVAVDAIVRRRREATGFACEDGGLEVTYILVVIGFRRKQFFILASSQL